MTFQPPRSEEFPGWPTGAGGTAQRLYRLAADTRAVETILETRDELGEGSATIGEGSGVEGRLSGLRGLLREHPSLLDLMY